MTNLLHTVGHKIAVGIVALSLSVAGLFGYAPQTDLGATIPVTPAVFSTSLAASITSTATSMTLVSGLDKAGNALSGYVCFTLDEGSSNEEFACGTASSTSVTSMIRGVDPIDGDLEVTALKQAHRRGASVKVTTYPITGILARILNGDETLPNAISYASGVSTSTIASSNANLVNVALLNDTAITGAVNATGVIQGLVELGTSAEIASSTQTGGTGASLVAPGGIFTGNATTSTAVPVTRSSGKLGQWFLNLTEAFSFSGGLTSSATTTLSANVVFSGLSKGLLYGSSTSAASTIAPSSTGSFLKSNGTDWIASSSLGISVGSATFSTSSVSGTIDDDTNVITMTLSAQSTVMLSVAGNVKHASTAQAGDCTYQFNVDNDTTIIDVGLKADYTSGLNNFTFPLGGTVNTGTLTAGTHTFRSRFLENGSGNSCSYSGKLTALAIPI